MKVCVLSSGSKGNTTYIESDKTKIIIDVGNTCKYVKEKLEEIGVSPNEINAVLITHTHSDHIKGLKLFINKYKIPVYITKGMFDSLSYLEDYHFIDDEFDINDMHITAIKTSHDAPDSRGYIVSNKDKSIVYITDTGYINRKYFDILKNKNIYIMESNHDVEMLTNGKYPFQLKQRILSDKGHLSNYDSSKYLSSFIGDNTKYIFLAHLSEDNNTEELAYETLNSKLKSDNIEIIIAKQDKETELVSI